MSENKDNVNETLRIDTGTRRLTMKSDRLAMTRLSFRLAGEIGAFFVDPTYERDAVDFLDTHPRVTTVEVRKPDGTVMTGGDYLNTDSNSYLDSMEYAHVDEPDLDKVLETMLQRVQEGEDAKTVLGEVMIAADTRRLVPRSGRVGLEMISFRYGGHPMAVFVDTPNKTVVVSGLESHPRVRSVASTPASGEDAA